MKIVSLIPSATEIIAALGLQDSLVGITHSCDYPPGLRARCVTSTTIPKDAPSGEIDRIVKDHARHGRPLYRLDAELLEELRPDLVVTQAVCDVCAVSEGQAFLALDRLSIRPTIISLHPHRFADVLSDVLLVGEAADVRNRAAIVVESLSQRVARIETRVNGRARLDVAVLEWIDPLFSAGHWTPDIVRMAGGREVLARAGDRSRELNWRDVRTADPDVLLLACCGQDVARTTHDLPRLTAKPGFREMKAVRADRVFVADGRSHFSRPGPRLIDSLELLAETLHPSGQQNTRALARLDMAKLPEECRGGKFPSWDTAPAG
jgi:iron complex transport system substrate-binding protein